MPHRCLNMDSIDGVIAADVCTGFVPQQHDKYDPERRCFDRDRPEWDTVVVAGGPGMDGVLPASCQGQPDTRGALQRAVPRELTMAVVSLHDDAPDAFHKPVGSGILITPSLILTASHVVNNPSPQARSVSFAAFGHRYVDAAEPMSHNDIRFSRVAKPNSGIVGRMQLDNKEIDYAILQIAKKDMPAAIKPMPLLNKSAMERALGMRHPVVLGYTANPFFPRGLIVSAGGDWIDPPALVGVQTNLQADIFYNVNTAKGFSGGAVLNSANALVAIHIRTNTADVIQEPSYGKCWPNRPKSNVRAAFRDFSRPNGGRSMIAILGDIAARNCDADLRVGFGENVGNTIATYREAIVPQPPCMSNISELALSDEPTMGRAVAREDTSEPVARTKEWSSKEAIISRHSRDPECDADFYSCLVDLMGNYGQTAVPSRWRGSRPAVGAIVRTIGLTDSYSELVGSAVLVSPRHVLTAGHVVSVPTLLEQWPHKFTLGYEPSEGADTRCVISRSLKPLILAKSARARLDYALLELEEPIKFTAAPADCSWQYLSIADTVERAQAGLSAFAVGHYSASTAGSGLMLFYNGTFTSLSRWTKDGGGTLNLDYQLNTEKGLSGGATLDGDFNWVALHQRRLSRASEETGTVWHPYNQWRYVNDSRWNILFAGRPSCDPDTWQKYRGQCLPAQGSLVTDIAEDIVAKRGLQWACAEVPKLANAAISASRRSDSCPAIGADTADPLSSKAGGGPSAID